MMRRGLGEHRRLHCFAGNRRDDGSCRHDSASAFAVWGEYAVKSYQWMSWRRDQARHELNGRLRSSTCARNDERCSRTMPCSGVSSGRWRR
jgi:hypothetical protein